MTLGDEVQQVSTVPSVWEFRVLSQYPGLLHFVDSNTLHFPNSPNSIEGLECSLS
jgi:hypothetical protein